MNKIYINNDWHYKPHFNEKTKHESVTEESMERVRLPHTNIELPYNCFDESIYQFVSLYKKNIYADLSWKNKNILLTFEGIAHIARVYINEEFVGEHFGGYTAFTINLSEYLNYGEENTIYVEVDSRESNNIPPFGFVIDYMTYGGIYREAYLEVKEQNYIEDIFVKTTKVNKEEKDLKLNLTLNELGDNEELLIKCYLKGINDESYLFLGEDTINKKESMMQTTVKDVKLWDIENPNRYYLKVELIKDNKILDRKEIRFGFRECEFRKDGFYLNNKKVKLIGLNRHQSYPYVGYAMPKRPQINDANILKYELGLNAVRTSHYPQSQHFIDRCDEIGLLVFTEIPGWQHIGDDRWKEVAIHNTEEMVLQYRNHPSIILWGVRINESQDDDKFYTKTNKIAYKLDDTRQTGGVRFIKKSSFLEDVYTYNDFSHTGKNKGLDLKRKVTPHKDSPYLVSEYNGHMFPTKTYDSEAHRLEHAKRHANVVDAIFEKDEITGGFGWCMFDYNTHKDFGSGDRICHHGVMNMFRVPKLAASVYSSQNEFIPVLEISSSMNIGDHPGGYIGDLYAFTNCDSVKVYKNKEYIKTFYPNQSKYKNMLHPPILIDDFVGELIEKHEGLSKKGAEEIKEVLFAVAKYGQHNLPFKYMLKMVKVMVKERLKLEDGVRLYTKYIGNWGGESISYTFEGITENQEVKSVTKETLKKVYLKVDTDTTELIEGDTYDVACVRIKVVDQHGEIIPYYQGVINLNVEGELELIGPSNISIIGGSFGTYIKTNGKKGKGRLQVSGHNLDSVVIDYIIK